MPATLLSPIESAQRRLEYFCIGLAGSVSDAVRRNWLALDGSRTNARNAMVNRFVSTIERSEKLGNKNFVDAQGLVWGLRFHHFHAP